MGMAIPSVALFYLAKSRGSKTSRSQINQINALLSNNIRLESTITELQTRHNTALSNAKKDATAALLKSLLPTLDSLDQATSASNSATTANDLMDGVKLINTSLHASLYKNGIKTIAAPLNTKFDPKHHEAMLVMPGGVKDDIGEVYRLGWEVHGRVVRATKVGVYGGA
jgi:molecular chaperone GrpE